MCVFWDCIDACVRPALVPRVSFRDPGTRGSPCPLLIVCRVAVPLLMHDETMTLQASHLPGMFASYMRMFPTCWQTVFMTNLAGPSRIRHSLQTLFCIVGTNLSSTMPRVPTNTDRRALPELASRPAAIRSPQRSVLLTSGIVYAGQAADIGRADAGHRQLLWTASEQPSCVSAVRACSHYEARLPQTALIEGQRKYARSNNQF